MSAANERRTETIPQWKREEVDELVELLESHDTVAIVGVTGIPSRQLQTMRRELHGDAALRMSRNTLLHRALEEVDEGLDGLTDEVAGEIGLLVSDSNPFRLYQQLEASKSPAPIGAGETAPNDIVIEAGDTGVDPGPFVGDLQNVGAAARIQDGSIHVTEDSTVLSAGETVSQDLANVLGELGVEPKEVGLDLRAAFADGVVFDPADLDIDVEAYRSDVVTAGARAQNLSINAEYPTAQTAPALLAIADGDARSLGLAAAIESPDLIEDLITLADGDLRSLAAAIDDPDALPEALADVEVPEPADDGGDGDSTPDAEDAGDGGDTDDAESSDDSADSEPDDDDDAGGDAGEGLGEMFG
jgi:large subunit ribosomal protein L10